MLALLAEGLSNKGIALGLGISDQAVKFHVASITASSALTPAPEPFDSPFAADSLLCRTPAIGGLPSRIARRNCETPLAVQPSPSQAGCEAHHGFDACFPAQDAYPSGEIPIRRVSPDTDRYAGESR